MKDKIKKHIKKILPPKIFGTLRFIYRHALLYRKYLILKQPILHERTLKRIRKKVSEGEKIKVAFFSLHSSMWKCDGLFNLMLESKLFEPIVVICPVVNYGKDNMLENMDKCIFFFNEKKYPIAITYDKNSDKYLDVQREINPDIIFYTNPYRGLIYKRYFITNQKNVLTCYIPYGVMSANIQQSQFNRLFHNLCWKIFCATSIHLQLSQKYAENKGVNVVFTGYPPFDELSFNANVIKKHVWKKQNTVKKKIIWAPHHTLKNNENELAYACFFQLSDFMFEIAEKYSDEIQIAFKPHPILKNKLYVHPEWGISLTNNYYEKWDNLPNGQFKDGDYIDLFLESDAMILDSSSFVIEYLITRKPSLFTIRDDSVYSKFNEFGILSFNLLYKTKNLKKDINNFIENIISGNDPMRNERIDFIDKYLVSPNNKTASENIYEYIAKIIKTDE
jgi:CDP-glycerol glycerophosphotransferase (TagB/SpsB family)